MLATLDQIRTALPDMMRNANTTTPFTARVFTDLVVLTKEIVKRQVIRPPGIL